MNIGSKIPTDNLVFGYDTGHPQVSASHESYKYNLGKPFTNVVNSNNLTVHSSGSLSKTGIIDGLPSAPFAVYNSSKILGGLSNWMSIFQYNTSIAVPNGQSLLMTVMIYVPDSYPANKFNINCTVEGSNTGLTQSPNTDINTGEWVRLRGYYHNDSGTSQNVSSLRIEPYTPSYWTGNDISVYGANFNVEIGTFTNTYKGAPALDSDSTRSTSGSLIDLTRGNDIDLADVSFDSNAQMTFDGTDDFIELNATLSDLVGSTPSAISFEFVAKADDLTNPIGISGDYTGPAGTGFGIKRSSSNNKLEFRVYATGGIPRSTTDIPTDSYFYGACVWDGTGTGEHRIYFNGVLETTDTSAGTTWNHASGDLRVGDIYNSMGVPGEWQGEIPLFRLYNKALTNKEVAQNFNAIRERFNI